MDVAGYYAGHLKQINEAISIICRKNGLTLDDEKDFAQQVHVQFIENDCKKLRDFKGNSSLKTYLYTVISNIFIDQVRVRWRSSAKAKSLGAGAVELEELVFKNQFSVHEACQILVAKPALAMDENTAHDILGKLTLKTARLRQIDDSEEHLHNQPHPSPDPETLVRQKQMEEQKRKLISFLDDIVVTLADQDQLIIKLLFESGHRISEIARLLGKDNRQLYKRTQMLLRNISERMTEAGIEEDDLREILATIGESGA